MKITTETSYSIDRFPDLSIHIYNGHKVVMFGLDDDTMTLDDLFALAKALNEIAEDAVNQATQWEISDPDAVDEDEYDDEYDDDPQLSFVFVFPDDEQ